MKGYICLIVLIILSLFSLSLSSKASCTATLNVRMTVQKKF